ncbi:unnamed protein product [Pleuronectes platessa]|uniref:Uncharacterized protein n=1 Tax=Pleuronectes platessa TaxID=8262 RepID=A0A9N7V821_PLEPL|nr:unnamed protein product [Pleuronectes platessa]
MRVPGCKVCEEAQWRSKNVLTARSVVASMYMGQTVSVFVGRLAGVEELQTGERCLHLLVVVMEEILKGNDAHAGNPTPTESSRDVLIRIKWWLMDIFKQEAFTMAVAATREKQ